MLPAPTFYQNLIDSVVQSGMTPDKLSEVFSKNNLETSIIYNAPFLAISRDLIKSTLIGNILSSVFLLNQGRFALEMSTNNGISGSSTRGQVG